MSRDRLWQSRWSGQPGRLEVWYATATTAAGLGWWFHGEVLARTDGTADRHGWFAVFPLDGPPVVERFGPVPVEDPAAVGAAGDWFVAGDVRVGPAGLRGTAGSVSWDVSWHDAGPSLHPFPRWAWNHAVLPAAQAVAAPAARFTGTITVGDREEAVPGRGAVSRIYGHGNAERWAWLHADLPANVGVAAGALDRTAAGAAGAGVLEIVAAVSTRPGLRRLPPLTFARLRLPGDPDWPATPLLASPLLGARIDLPTWTVAGVVGTRRLRVRVHIPPERAVTLSYADPDGRRATCTNSERADALIRVDRWRGRWRRELDVRLDATAHAEVGLRRLGD